jgi:hypothetical protein
LANGLSAAYHVRDEIMAFKRNTLATALAAIIAVFAASCACGAPPPLVSSLEPPHASASYAAQHPDLGKCPESADCQVSAEYWSRSCYARARAFAAAAETLWAPKSECLKPAADASEQERHDASVMGEMYAELSPWSSSGAWPDRLTIVLVRAAGRESGTNDERGINIYSDGKALVGSLRCPHERSTRLVSTAQLQSLRNAFAEAKFMNLPACNGLVSDSRPFAVGFFDGSTRKVVYSTEASISFPSWKLAQLIDDVVGGSPSIE